MISYCSLRQCLIADPPVSDFHQQTVVLWSKCWPANQQVPRRGFSANWLLKSPHSSLMLPSPLLSFHVCTITCPLPLLLTKPCMHTQLYNYNSWHRQLCLTHTIRKPFKKKNPINQSDFCPAGVTGCVFFLVSNQFKRNSSTAWLSVYYLLCLWPCETVWY